MATAKDQVIRYLALISFIYLLRLEEYTQKYQKNTTHTIQFRCCDIAFKRGNNIIPRDALDTEIMGAPAAILHLSNQKNGIRGILMY